MHATSTKRPTKLSADITSRAAGSHHTIFALADGSVKGVGTNDNGQLGNGETLNHNVDVVDSLVNLISG